MSQRTVGDNPFTSGESMPKTKYKVGDRVYVQLHERSPHLYHEEVGFKSQPRMVTVIGIVHTAEFKHGLDSRPEFNSETIRYATSYSRGEWIPEDRLYKSVEEFESIRADEIAALAKKRAQEAREKRAKQYREAKQLVANYEAEVFEAHNASTP